MDRIENNPGDRFKTLEMELRNSFSQKLTQSLWGDSLHGILPDATIKSEGRPVQADASITEMEFDGTVSDVSVLFTVHSDGSASMTMPGANVSLTPRNTSIASGGEYEIGEVLGMGGMGVVNLARQASLDRRIVVKTIRPEFANKMEAQEKFITEALATGSLDHPNVVPVHDMGVAADGNLFYVMKEVKGRNWKEILSTLSERENIEILQKVCDAVACAHDKGIIHRDIKPENVMIGDYGEVLLMDWGLAAAISPAAKAAHLTDTDACAGTPSFMAPEMARGLADDLGPWSDQYLLGATLFVILSGTSPHPGIGALEGVQNAANNVIRETSRNDEWMKVARRAMETAPNRRFPSVKEFQEALRNCQTHGESIILTRQGEELLERAEDGSGYEDYARSIYAFERALALWNKNPDARECLDEAVFAYASSAVDKGDYDLALSLLDKPRDQDEIALRDEALRERSLRETRRRRVKLFAGVAALALVLVAVIAGVAAFVISRQAGAERRARAEAERQKSAADQQRTIADQQRAIAQREQEIAEEQRAIAQREQMIAEDLRQKAEEALQVAQEARRAEAEAKDTQLREQELKLQAEERARQRAEEALLAREQIQRLGYLEDNSRWRFDAEEAARRQKITADETGLAVAMTVEVPDTSIPMRLIPAGGFVMGSPPRDPSRNNDEYLHEVDLSRPFHMGATEITRGQWRAVVGMETLESVGMKPGDAGILNVTWRFRTVFEDDASLPATGISYNDIVTVFLPKLTEIAKGIPAGGTFRLPTEAEWEWAARAGTTDHFPAALDTCGWYENNSHSQIHRIGEKEANAWGLHDVAGNVAELALDRYDSLFYLRSPKVDPVNLDTGVKASRVCRGGSYVNSPRLCRLSNRTYMHEENRYPHAGFRIVWIPDVKEE